MRSWRQRSLAVRVLIVLVVLAVVGLELHLWLVGYDGETSTAAVASVGYVLFPLYGIAVIGGALIVESACRAGRRFAHRNVS